MTPASLATLAAVGAIAAAIATVVAVILRNSRRSPETRTALDNGWDKLTGGLERNIVMLQAADADKSRRLADLERTVAEQAKQLGHMERLNEWLIRRVAQLLAFIAGHQLTPPDEEPRPD